MAVIRPARMMEILTNENVTPSFRSQFVSECSSVMSHGAPGVSAAMEGMVVRDDYYGTRIPNHLPPLTQERAQLLLTTLRDVTISQGYFHSKSLRPWAFDDEVYAGLDPDSVWWGWEFETGYVSPEARAQVIAHAWDTWDGVTYDSEGEGNAASEITFVPQEMSRFLDDTADACQFSRYLSDNPELISSGNYGDMIGTHINFSFPEFRQSRGYNIIHRVSNALWVSMLYLPNTSEFRRQHFGRDMVYAGFYPQSSWIEGKLFRTTYDHNRFRDYIKTARGLTKAARAIIDCGQEYVACCNLDELFTDPDAPVRLKVFRERVTSDYVPGRSERAFRVTPISAPHRDQYGTPRWADVGEAVSHLEALVIAEISLGVRI